MNWMHTVYDGVLGRAFQAAAARGVNATFHLPAPPDALVERIVRHSKKRPYFDLPGYMGRDFNHRGQRMTTRTHRILRSDLDRHLHTHPWPYATWILRTGYFEITPKDFGQSAEQDQDPACLNRVWHPPGTFLIRCHPQYRHRLEVVDGSPATTLFSHLAKVRDWGFNTEHGLIYWEWYDDYKLLGESELSQIAPGHPCIVGADGWAHPQAKKPRDQQVEIPSHEFAAPAT